jgi:hypothetical protein
MITPVENLEDYKLTICADSGYEAESSGRCNSEQYSRAVAALCGVKEATETKPILLWAAPAAPKPEPVATLRYGDMAFEIPYTLMGWLHGWVVMGGVGTYASEEALTNVQDALENMRTQMGFDASPLSQETIDFYTAHNIPFGPCFKKITDFRNKK